MVLCFVCWKECILRRKEVKEGVGVGKGERRDGVQKSV